MEPDGFYEAVDATGRLFRVPRHQARHFARLVGITDDQNFLRVMDPNVPGQQFVEHWQGLHNVRWLELLDKSQNITDRILIWGQPSHSMEKFYSMVKMKHGKKLPAFNT